MVRVLLREALLTALCVALVSVAAFALLDRLGPQDWYTTAASAHLFDFSAEHATARDLPLLWNPRVLDADLRTRADLLDLGIPARRTEAMGRLVHRGAAAYPTVQSQLAHLDPARRRDALTVLARWAPWINRGQRAPTPDDDASTADAIAWWERFENARGLDFRLGYALRQAQRLAARDSRNAAERLTQLGTYALPAIFQELSLHSDREGRQRLTAALADITRIPVRAAPDAPVAEVNRVTDAWGAFWFAEHLEYETLTGWQRGLGRALETRYGRWLTRALSGRFGRSVVTQRPVSVELRERLPVSALTSGLGGLLGTAVVIAFGGGTALQRRRLKARLLDLVGALIPGLAALAVAWASLLRLCTPANLVSQRLSAMFGDGGWFRMAVGTAIVGAFAAWWLKRPRAAIALHIVRVEAEGWVHDRMSPGVREVLRHGARIGIGSLLAPLGLAAPVVILASLGVERVVGLQGMGDLTLRALVPVDAPWLMVALLTLVPLFLGRRWALGMFFWVLGSSAHGSITVREERGAP